MSEMIETYRGEALAWEADELGHMNMRYYFAKSAQARAAFFGQLHLPSAFKARALSTLVATRQHIKYHKEVRPGVGMAIKTGILSLSETDIVLVHMITQSPQKLAATVVETLSHISVRTGRAFAWPKRVHEHAAGFTVDMPQDAAPRNVDVDEELGMPSFKGADKLGLQAIGRGMFLPSECDVFGYVTPSAIIGRVSDSAQHLKTAWPLI